MSTRDKHTVPDVEEALRYAEDQGWRIEVRHDGHVWGRIFCPQSTRSGCQMSVSSTPRSPGNEARRIRRFVDNCPR